MTIYLNQWKSKMKNDLKSVASRAIEEMMKNPKEPKKEQKPEVQYPVFNKAKLGLKDLEYGVDYILEQTNRPSDMTYDLSYQRDPAKRWATKLAFIAEKFDPRIVGLLHGVRRTGSDKIWLIDGAGRLLVMERIKYNEPVPVFIHLHIKDDVAKESDWFLRLNPEENAKVNPAQKYKARLVAKDKLALAIEKEAVAGGLKVTGSGQHGVTINTATALHTMGCLVDVGEVKNELWPFKVAGQFYIALGAFLKCCPTATMKRMKATIAVPTINKNHKNVLLEIESQVYKTYGRDASHARDMAPRAVLVMADKYNKGLAVKNQVNPRLGKIDDLMRDHYDQWKPMNE